MNELKIYFKFLKKNHLNEYMTYVGIMIFISLIVNISAILASKQLWRQPMTLGYSITTINVVFLFVIGVILGSKDFSGAMTIRSDRKNYFKAMVIFSIVSVILLCILDLLISKGICLSIKLSNSNLNFDSMTIVFTETTMWNKFFKVVVKLTPFQMFILKIIKSFYFTMLGIFLGAFAYRLRKLTSIIIYSGVGIVYIILSNNPMNYFKISSIMSIKNRILEIINNYYVDFYSVGLMYIILSAIFIGLSYLCLRKAPIGEYAHDWL
ncbi:hypothetical protein [Clostridium ihumii]|uniref:hypothetical protein n=1 Tax=Clostridium ihumii TaxID=1470356 RepID=UPI003D3395B2